MEEVVKLRKQLTRTRVLVFILLAFCFVFLVFAYLQKLDADRQHDRVVAIQNQMEDVKLDAIKNAEQARHMEIVAKQSELAAKQALEECQKK